MRRDGMQTISNATWRSPEDNLLLAALSAAEYRKLLPNFQLVSLSPGKFVAEAGELPTHAYFPTTAILSITTAIAGHVPEEVGVVGYEGMIGISLLLEGGHALGPMRSKVVHGGGYAYRVRGEFLRRAFFESDELRLVLLRYTQALITQVAQTAACNRHHRVAEQLCRWLLLRLDRSSGDELKVTQQQIANLLGVRREGVTEVARGLQQAGIIDYRRGSVTVLDRSGLERSACECYAVLREEYARLVPSVRHRATLGYNPVGRNPHPQRGYARLKA